MRRIPLARVAALLAFTTLIAAGSLVGGCSVMDRLRPGTKAEATGSTTKVSASPDAIDPRRFIGPNYCPELRIYDGAQLIRTYDRGHQGDANFVIWQASIGSTARECLYDEMGRLTIKVGISGRAVTGPKGQADLVPLPLKIAVVKYRESVLASEKVSVSMAIPATGSAMFSEVKEIDVPSPGNKRDYIIYVGFDVGDWDPMQPNSAAVAAVEPPPVPVEAAIVEPPPALSRPQKPKTSPNELPTPTGGFVLSQ